MKIPPGLLTKEVFFLFLRSFVCSSVRSDDSDGINVLLLRFKGNDRDILCTKVDHINIGDWWKYFRSINFRK